MGREIRRVPPHWEHPRDTEGRRAGDYKPLYNRTWEQEVCEWKEGFAKWEAGLRPGFHPDTKETVWQPKAEWSYADIYADQPDLEWWEYHSSPPTDRDDYRPYSDADAVWFQVYETVSEGTPVTPAFATREELVEYLATRGDFWDQSRGDGPWKRETAERFVNVGWAPSMMVVQDKTGTAVKMPRDGQ
jgi:hypothetical protein